MPRARVGSWSRERQVMVGEMGLDAWFVPLDIEKIVEGCDPV